MAPKRRTTRLNPGTTHVTTPSTTTTSVTDAQLQAMIDEGVNAALAARDATRNGDDSHTSRTGARRHVQAARECSYSEFLKCKPLDFKGTEGVIELTRWFEKMESVFSISNYTASNQIRPTLTVADKCRADDKLIGRLRREWRYFCIVATTYAQEVAHSRDYCTRIMDYCQSREVHTSTLVTQIEALRRDVSTLQRQHIEHAQRDVAPEDGDSCS
nr:hypothetical protein [Tanacetum cinerariifolium]